MNLILNKFNQLLDKLQEGHSLPESLSEIIRDMELEFKFQTISIFLREETNPENFRIKISRNVSQKFINSCIINEDNQFISDVFSKDFILTEDNELFQLENEFTQLLLTPISFNNDEYGFIAISVEDDKFSDDQIEKAKIFSHIIGFVINNLKNKEIIEQISINHNVTNLLTMKGLLKIGNLMIKNFSRYDKPITISALKIFHYREIYNQYGKENTNKILSEIANIIEKETRDNEIVAHIYDDVFAIIFPDTKQETAKKIISRLSSDMYKIDKLDKGKIHWGTCSFKKNTNDLMTCLKEAISKSEDAYHANCESK